MAESASHIPILSENADLLIRGDENLASAYYGPRWKG